MSQTAGPRPLFCIVLFTFLTACGQEATALPLVPSAPTAVLPTSVPAPTFVFLNTTPTPTPTGLVFPAITPDPVQVEKWDEYEDALAGVIHSYLPPDDTVCEWEILGQTEQEVYVWAYCATTYSAGSSLSSVPVVIHLGTDGSVEGIETPGDGTAYATGIRRLFPPDIQERIFSGQINSQGWGDRLRWRRAHPDDPPLIVLPFLPARPTPTLLPMIPPDPVQVQKWKEYQTILAKNFDYLPPEQVLCEWEVLGRSGNEIYVWAVCGAIWSNRVGLEGLARVDVVDDGSVAGAMRTEDRRIFPPEVLERYFTGAIHFQELVDHLRWRQQHPEEPPLAALVATPTP